jgi:hypothetical protein
MIANQGLVSSRNIFPTFLGETSVVNPVVWFEIAAADLDRAKSFYEAVFGSTFQFIDMGTTRMHMFNGDSALPGASGALVHSPDNTVSADGVTIYFASADITTELDRVAGAGGRVLVPKTSIGEFGFIGMFLDSEGNRIGLHSVA